MPSKEINDDEADSCARSTRASSRKNRVDVFRDFLWKTYGTLTGTGCNTCLLRKGAVILDVAGGKGDLSWLLMNADDVTSVVVDPRTLASSSHWFGRSIGCSSIPRKPANVPYPTDRHVNHWHFYCLRLSHAETSGKESIHNAMSRIGKSSWNLYICRLS